MTSSPKLAAASVLLQEQKANRTRGSVLRPGFLGEALLLCFRGTTPLSAACPRAISSVSAFAPEL